MSITTHSGPAPVSANQPDRPAPAARTGTASRTGWLLLALTSLAIAVFAAGRYATGSLARLADQNAGLAANYTHRGVVIQAAFYLHVVAGGLALLASPWQFAARLRERRPGLHRWLGRVSLVAIALGALAGLVIAPVNRAGIGGFFGFGMLAVLWGYSALRSYRAVRAGDLATHQAWAIRTFALTYAAVMLRLWLGVLIGVQVPFASMPVGPDTAEVLFTRAYAAVPFLCWVPNMMLAEWLIRRRGLPRR